MKETFSKVGWRDVENPPEVALKLFRQSNLIDKFTKTAIQNVLRGPSAMEFLTCCEEVTDEDYESAWQRLQKAEDLKPLRKWPALTYLSFFWCPDKHVFLKPEFTKEFSKRVGHNFHIEYDPQPNTNTYLSLIDLASTTREKCAGLPGGDKIDNIDAHSFMWAVIDYTAQDVGPPEK